MAGKVVVIGDGNVGKALSFAIFIKGVAKELAIIDLDFKKVGGDVLDLIHGSPFVPDIKVKVGSYADCKDAAVIAIAVNPVGAAFPKDRNELLVSNLRLMKGILPKIKANLNPSAKVLLITNPVDSMAFFASKVLGLPANQVIGSGTVLDSSRFKVGLSARLGVSVKDIDAYVVGEHGNSEVPVFSSAMIGGTRLDHYLHDNGKSIDRKEVWEEVVKGGFTVGAGKGCTNYAIALSATRIIEALQDEQPSLLPVSSFMGAYEGVRQDIYMSLPALVNDRGVLKIIGVDMDGREEEALAQSESVLSDLSKTVSSFANPAY